MKTLIKTLECSNGEIFVIKHHQRHYVGISTPKIEIYQNKTEVKTLGNGAGKFKTYEFSFIICPDPELDKLIKPDWENGIESFELKMTIKNHNDVFIPYEFAGLTDFCIESYKEWIFNVNDYELTQKLINL